MKNYIETGISEETANDLKALIVEYFGAQNVSTVEIRIHPQIGGVSAALECLCVHSTKLEKIELYVQGALAARRQLLNKGVR